MTPTEWLVSNFQELVAQVPELIQPFVVLFAGAIPFLEAEGASIIGIAGGMNPIVVAIAAMAGNFLSVLLVVLFSSRARSAVVDRRSARVAAMAGGPAAESEPPPSASSDLSDPDALSEPESKGRRRFKRWLVRFGVPGATLLGPLAIPTQFTAAILVAAGTPRRWALLWQAVAIVLWGSIATISAWAALTFLIAV